MDAAERDIQLCITMSKLLNSLSESLSYLTFTVELELPESYDDADGCAS